MAASNVRFLSGALLVVAGVAVATGVASLLALAAGVVVLVGAGNAWRWWRPLVCAVVALWLLVQFGAVAVAVAVCAVAVAIAAVAATLAAHRQGGQLGPFTGPIGRLDARFALRRSQRRWEHLCRLAGIPAPGWVRSEQETGAGTRFEVALPAGVTVEDLARQAGRLASASSARQVRVTADPGNANRATVLFVYADPLAAMTDTRWPGLDATRLSLWDPIPVGLDENGEPVTVSLVERSVLVGGNPGAGKSNFVSMIVATAALDPNAHLHLLDGKGMLELGGWQAAAATAAATPEEAVRVLDQVRQILDQRVKDLGERGLRKVQPGDELHLVAIDELAEFTAGRPDSPFNKQLRSLVSLGRAAGIIVLGATQKPEGKVVPTAIRDLMAIRVALHCRTPEASDTILGSGMAASGANAATIPHGQSGTAILLSEGAEPFLFRGFHVPDEHLEQLQERAATPAGNLRDPAARPESTTPAAAGVAGLPGAAGPNGRPGGNVATGNPASPGGGGAVALAAPPGLAVPRFEDRPRPVAGRLEWRKWYDEVYCRSEYWAWRRGVALAAAGGACARAGCEREAVQVHHRSYARMAAGEVELPGDLEALCDEHHWTLHADKALAREAMRARARDLVAAGVSDRRAGEVVGVSHTTIRNWRLEWAAFGERAAEEQAAAAEKRADG